MNPRTRKYPLAVTIDEKPTHHQSDFNSSSPTGAPEELLTINPVLKARGCKSRTTIWNEIRDGLFPPPDMVRKRIRYWRASTLRKWQDANVGSVSS